MSESFPVDQSIPSWPKYRYPAGDADAMIYFGGRESLFDLGATPARWLNEQGHPRPLWLFRAITQRIAIATMALLSPGGEIGGDKKELLPRGELFSLRDQLARLRRRAIQDGHILGASVLEMSHVLDRIYQDCCAAIDPDSPMPNDEDEDGWSTARFVATRKLGVSVLPIDDLLESVRPQEDAANGPLPPDMFRFEKGVAEGLSSDQFRLLSLLWDAPLGKPKEASELLLHVCQNAGNQMEALRKLRQRAQATLTDAGIPLSIKWKDSSLRLVIDK